MNKAIVVEHRLSDNSPVFDVVFKQAEGYPPIHFGAVSAAHANVLAEALNNCVSWVQVGN